MRKFFEKFTFEYKRQKALSEFKKKIQKLRDMSNDELKYEQITTQTLYERKKGLLTLFLITIILAVIMNVWDKFFSFMKMAFEYAGTLATGNFDIIKISFWISFIIAAIITVVVFAYVLVIMKDISDLKKDLSMVETVMNERNKIEF